MSFVWTSITPDLTPVEAAQANEIRNAVNLLTIKLSITGYTWTNLPISITPPKTIVQVIHMSELRAAIDYVSDNNICLADNSTYNSPVCPTNHVPYYGGN
jgi:hypothetical protein